MGTEAAAFAILGAPGMGMEWRCESSEKLGRRDLKRCRKAKSARVTLKEAASRATSRRTETRYEAACSPG